MDDKPSGAAGRISARRRFLIDAARMASGLGLFGLGLGLYARKARARRAQLLRPPGALDEPAFLGACIRCGLCVRDCPYHILRLARPQEDAATGTPFFIAREKPCEMCTDIPCVAACPTGALDHALTDIAQARMGLAVLADQENCLNFLGGRCELCYRTCPLIDKAITLETQLKSRSDRRLLFIPTVHSDACTGCGKCEQACPLEAAAIRVQPIAQMRGGPPGLPKGEP